MKSLSCWTADPGIPALCAPQLHVLQLQSASTSPQSQAVDYESGIEATILAILQQTIYSQNIELAELKSCVIYPAGAATAVSIHIPSESASGL